MGRLDGKVAVVTGASSGIGQATFELFASEGARVVGGARTASKLERALENVKKDGGTGIVVPGDLSIDKNCETLVKNAIDKYGQLDIVVNCVGVGWSFEEQNPGAMAALDGVPTEAWHKVMGILLDPYVFVTRAALQQMIKQHRGSIVNIGSMGGIAGLYDAHAYTAAKGAIVNLTRSLAITYIKQGIRANCVCPGFVDTPMIAPVIHNFDNPDIAKALTPIARPAKAFEIAAANLFFASDDSSYCNGAILSVDGGCTARSFPG